MACSSRSITDDEAPSGALDRLGLRVVLLDDDDDDDELFLDFFL
jgi:hypothetical protein